MFKRIFILILAILFVLSITACKKEPNQTATDTTTSVKADGTAASAVTTAAETTAAETTAAAVDKYAYIDFYEDTGVGHNAYKLATETSSIGMHFKVAEGFIEDFSINCPSWSDDIGSVTMRIYKWNTDYATTVAGTPAAEETFIDYVDNSWNFMYFNTGDVKGLEAGEYLVTLSDGVDASGTGVGLRSMGPSTDPAVIECFADGVVTTTYGWEASATVSIPG